MYKYIFRYVESLTKLGNSSWMPYAPQGVTVLDDDDDVDSLVFLSV
jgi:hypothetical protein